MSLTSELIRKKRDGRTLTEAEIGRFIEGVTSHSVSDAQIAAFAMAVWFRGMDAAELTALTTSMRDSGTVLHWPDIPGPVMDKHSTGGVGDLVSLVLAPMVAACGGYVPMISGRGLGHTGGTLDKLESIPGFNTSPSGEEFRQLVRQNGLSIIGQTVNLAPADKRIYAVRDVTGTVASIPLIVSSILSKKLAEGLDALVMDIKVGNGAFMETVEDAHRLAAHLCTTAENAGLPCNAVLTDMNQAMSWSAGNAVEVREATAYLRGDQRHPRLHQVVLAIASEMLCLGGLAKSPQDAIDRLESVLADGAAAEKFSLMVREQGGPADLLENPDSHLPEAAVVRPLILDDEVWIRSKNMTALGFAVVRLGGGRLRAEDEVDHSVGLSNLPGPGDRIEKGEPLLFIHARDENSWDQAAEQCRAAFEFSGECPETEQRPVILDRVIGKNG